MPQGYADVNRLRITDLADLAIYNVYFSIFVK